VPEAPTTEFWRGIKPITTVFQPNLHRLFSADGDSVSRCIWRERLEHAHDDLTGPGLQHLGVGEIAARRGFASQVHFARAHRARYGSTPSAARAGSSRS
jgi:transcriptional regulator GlxA family with amidase domain